MLAEIGLVATALSFVTAWFAIGASIYGERRNLEGWVISGRNAALFTALLLFIATGALTIALMNQQYQIRYIWSVTSPNMTDLYRFTALWGSQAGSLLFWTFLMAAFSAGAILSNWRGNRQLMPYAIAVMMAVTVFFISLVLFLENPFERYWIVGSEVVTSALIPAGAIAPDASRLAATSNGLNPLLHHFGMAIHPPTLYIGFVAFIIPFAFAVAALAVGDFTTSWIKASRRWTLVAWLFLSLGLLLGGRWAYDVLGWGGYWGWDPVENAALLPWLVGTALIHSSIIQEKRGMLKTWNLFLVVMTFSAVIFGTFATRSGLVDSVHSFARSEVGVPMFLFWSSLTLLAAGLILWRRGRGELRDEHRISNVLSRESLFVLNNFVFVALFVAVFWGSFGAPIVSEMFMDTQITLGEEYFLRVTPPLFVAMFVLMGVAPLSAWSATTARRLGRALVIPVLLTVAFLVVFVLLGMSSIGALVGYGIISLSGMVILYETYRAAAARRRSVGENWLQAFANIARRNPRRYGGYLVHLGITVMGIGMLGSTLFQFETQRTMAVGETIQVQDYQFRYDALREGQIALDGRLMDIAEVTVLRDGREVAHLRPRRDFFPETSGLNTMTIAGSHSTLENDFYVLLVGWEDIGAHSATFKIYINPLVNWIWLGGVILMLGTFVSVWPRGGATVRQSARVDRAAVAPA